MRRPRPPASTAPTGAAVREAAAMAATLPPAGRAGRASILSVMGDLIGAHPWLRCYRCWSQDLEVQVHYEGIHRIDPQTGERAEVVDELQEAVVQCLECMHDQPH